MSEDVTTPEVEAGPDLSPSTEAVPNPSEIGQDMFPDEPVADSPAETPEPVEEAFDIDKVDLLSIDPNRLPDQYKPLQQYARRFQSQMDRERNTARQEQENARSERQQYIEAIQKLQTPQTPGQATDPYADIDLTPQERAGLGRLEQVFQETHVKPLAEKMSAVDTQLAQVNQLVSQLQGHVQNQQAQGIRNEISALTEAYPEADYRDERIIALSGKMNPETNKAYTLKESYEVIFGKKVDEVVEQRLNSIQLKNGAKNTASRRPSTTPASGSSKISESEGLAELSKLGFES